MEIHNNPFAVKTPESLNAAEIVDLFVPYPEFATLQESGHQFLHGHRGSGKSMMLRMLEPECQSLHRNVPVEELPFFGIYLSIKATEINQPEFERLQSEPSGFILSEHVLTTKILSKIISSVQRHLVTNISASDTPRKVEMFVTKYFVRRLELCGWNPANLKLIPDAPLNEIFTQLTNVVDDIQASTLRYVKGRAFSGNAQPYDGALLGFQDVLLPLVSALRSDALLPNCPVYILIDDADNLTEQQTKILNTWVSYRTTDLISLKVSTQLGYKTYLTSGGVSIESPHDFAEIHFTTARTGSHRGGYTKLVEDIVSRRLKKYGLAEISVRDFFPEDFNQSIAIAEIEEELKLAWETKENGGYRASDDAYRLARPEFIRRLSSKSKQFPNYRYAGFEQLVHISSGIIRYFLDPAAKMFADELKKNNGEKVKFISSDIQDLQIRHQSDALLIDNFEILRKESDHGGVVSAHDIDCLKNLVQGIGFLFQAYLLDKNASQRRVFSFFLADDVNDPVRNILDLGVRLGYFYKDSIAKKEGRGRTVLYVLTRRLAPVFKLDPVGFSGYISVTNNFLASIIRNPNTYKERLKSSDDVEQLGFGF